MITEKMIKDFADSHSIGETFERDNKNLTTERIKVNEKVRIIEKHKHYCVVTNGRYNYCLLWTDLIRKELVIGHRRTASKRWLQIKLKRGTI